MYVNCAMPTNAEPLLLDTSAAIALVSPNHEHHSLVRERTKSRQLGLAGHAAHETYSVLTRLPPPQRLTPAAAARLIRHNFPKTVTFQPVDTLVLLDGFAAKGISGGQVYDALVAAAALDRGLVLLTVDARAKVTYSAVGVEFEVIRP